MHPDDTTASAPDNRDRRAYFGAYNAAHLQDHLEYAAAYRAGHREELRVKATAYRAAHRAEKAAYDAAHKEERRAAAAAWRAAHRDEFLAKRRVSSNSWYAAHREEARAKRAANSEHKAAYRAAQNAQREEVLRAWASSGCLVCGFSDLRAIDAHHPDPSLKDRGIGTIRNPSTLTTALSICVPLCRNHHAILHAMLRNGSKGCATADMVAILKAERKELP